MLTVINLFVIDKIFNEVAEATINASARALYVNCLTHHFRDKSRSVSCAIAFKLYKQDFNFDRYKKQFYELEKAKLVCVAQDYIEFNNCWGKFIDRTLLEKQTPMEYVANFQPQKATSFKSEMIKSKTLDDLAGMKHKVKTDRLHKLIEIFVLEQDAVDRTYLSYSECARHFCNWLPFNCEKVSKEVVKSTAKILGT